MQRLIDFQVCRTVDLRCFFKDLFPSKLEFRFSWMNFSVLCCRYWLLVIACSILFNSWWISSQVELCVITLITRVYIIERLYCVEVCEYKFAYKSISVVFVYAEVRICSSCRCLCFTFRNLKNLLVISSLANDRLKSFSMHCWNNTDKQKNILFPKSARFFYIFWSGMIS